MKQLFTSRVVLASAALLAFASVTACGDDSSDGSGSGGDASGSTATGTTTATSTSTGPTTASSSSGGEGGEGGGTGGSGIGGFPEVPEACDPLVPTQCGFPFPSNFWLVDDDATATGHRVVFAEGSLPTHPDAGPIGPALVGDSDGFSTGQAPMTHLPGATTVGLATQNDIETSLDATSPTVLIDVDSGELVPHFAELDMNEPDPNERAFMIRPAVRLRDDARYVVGIRNVVDASGTPIEATPGFRALRDDVETDDERIESRRDLFDDIFEILDDAGVDRGDLQIAWDFSTASRENNTAWLLHMRDVALAAVGEAGPAYEIDEVLTGKDVSERIDKRIIGRFEVPSFMTDPDPGAALVFGDDGMPEIQETAEYTFVVQIPNAATTGTPGAILQTGHGLLGTWNQGLGGYYANIADEGNFIHCAVDMIGMAEVDQPTAISAIITDPMIFRPFVERQLQGMVNQLVFMRMMKGDFAADPEVQYGDASAIDTTQAYYRGSSQGGIFGGTYMAISTDVTRGILDVPGAPYNLLLNRSVDFDPFFTVLRLKYENSRDLQIVLGVLQMLWDRVEPNGYLPYLRTDTLPNTPPHEVLFHVAIGDHQVSPLGAHYMARTIGASLVVPAARDVWGLEEQRAPFTGSALVEYDYGDLVPPLPETNTPTEADSETDPHGWTRSEPTQIEQSDIFLRTGQITQQCDGGCDPN
jgi:hypothetical protein